MCLELIKIFPLDALRRAKQEKKRRYQVAPLASVRIPIASIRNSEKSKFQMGF